MEKIEKYGILNRDPLQSNVRIIKVFHDNVEDRYLNDEYTDRDPH